MLIDPGVKLLVAAEGAAQELRDAVVLAAVEELAVDAQHLDDAGLDGSGEERLLARLVFGFDHGMGCPPRWNVMRSATRERCVSCRQG
jgi:hypothetical protein